MFDFPTSFRRFLLEESLYDPNLVRAFAIRLCGANSRSNIRVCIDLIEQYFERERMALIEDVDHSNQTNLLQPYIDSLAFMNMVLQMLGKNEKKFHITSNITKTDTCSHGKTECTICYEDQENIEFIKLNCGHEFCKDCIKKTLQNEIKETVCCALCRKKIEKFEFKSEKVRTEFTDLIV